MVTFRSSKKLNSYLVWAKLYPLERVTDSCRCHEKRCAMGLNLTKHQLSPVQCSLRHKK